MSAAEPTPEELADYMADHYGRCTGGAEYCRRHGCNGARLATRASLSAVAANGLAEPRGD